MATLEPAPEDDCTVALNACACATNDKKVGSTRNETRHGTAKKEDTTNTR